MNVSQGFSFIEVNSVFGLSGILTASDHRFSHLACLMCSRHVEMGHPVWLMCTSPQEEGFCVGSCLPVIDLRQVVSLLDSLHMVWFPFILSNLVMH
jgi:hypothetical protein